MASDDQSDDRAAPSGPLAGFIELDRLLRGELTRLPSLARGAIDLDAGRLSTVLVFLSALYGLCMGTFALFSARGGHAMQAVASMVKVPLLFYATLVVTLPSLYVFNALIGSRLTLTSVVRLLVGSLGVTVAVLASLGPIVAFFSVSTTSYGFILLFNVATFALSGLLGSLFLLRTLHRLSAAQARSDAPRPPTAPGDAPVDAHVDGDATTTVTRASPPPPRALAPASEEQALGRHVKTIFRLWLVVFALVGAQMGWVLRPFIGDPHAAFTWLRGRESSFFEAVARTVVHLLSR